MTDKQLLDRITADPATMAGKPIIRGTRLTVEFLLKLLAHRATEAEILAELAATPTAHPCECSPARELLGHRRQAGYPGNGPAAGPAGGRREKRFNVTRSAPQGRMIDG